MSNHRVTRALGLKDSSRDLQVNYIISFYFHIYLVLHAYAAKFNMMKNFEKFLVFLGELSMLRCQQAKMSTAAFDFAFSRGKNRWPMLYYGPNSRTDQKASPQSPSSLLSYGPLSGETAPRVLL